MGPRSSGAAVKNAGNVARAARAARAASEEELPGSGDKPAEVPITGIHVPLDSSLLARLSKLEAQVLALKECQKTTSLQVSKHASGIEELYSSIDAINETQASWGADSFYFYLPCVLRHPKLFFADDEKSAEEPANKKVKVEAVSGALSIPYLTDIRFFQEVISSCMPRRLVCWTKFGFSSRILEFL